ncbi:MAG: 1-acyl-sn-glycerol-3-phosphate acyltransferase [Armatimonadetes bacterium]|nr:1-acyl-sn-glycerol-3-phosphate acyltransferase [Armatimonadota bacterium]
MDDPQPESNDIELQSPLFGLLGLPFWRFVARVMLLVLGPLRVRNKRQIPGAGGLLILSNHLADVDPVAIQVGCPRAIYFMGKSELFEMPFLGRFLHWFRAFPVKRGEPDRTAIKKAVAYLKAGQAVCVFPEGELSESSALLPLKPGVALIARMADVPIICAGINGTNRILPYGRLLPKPAFGGVSLRWGEPHKFEKGASAEEIMGWVEQQLRSLTDQPLVSSPNP